jgi:hypothetical protein
LHPDCRGSKYCQALNSQLKWLLVGTFIACSVLATGTEVCGNEQIEKSPRFDESRQQQTRRYRSDRCVRYPPQATALLVTPVVRYVVSLRFRLCRSACEFCGAREHNSVTGYEPCRRERRRCEQRVNRRCARYAAPHPTFVRFATSKGDHVTSFSAIPLQNPRSFTGLRREPNGIPGRIGS